MYNFDSETLLRKKRTIRRELTEGLGDGALTKRIAILGGSTTAEIKDMMEIFLLKYGIKPTFYESEYNMFFQDGAFENPKLKEFAPDFIYIHTSSKNIPEMPQVGDSKETVDKKFIDCKEYFLHLWTNLERTYNCTIIQNNFELPFYRLLGNQDSVYYYGFTNFIMRLNLFVSEYAAERNQFFVHDINYEAATMGIDRWSDIKYWSMYKYAMSREAIPVTAYNVALIIKSLLGKNKKALSLDLDNTLWGGVIGDDGAENIEIGHENAIAECYTQFQNYIKKLKDIGVILTVNSKNNEDTAKQGFQRPDSVLRLEDFIDFKANWNPKCNNIVDSAKKINILPDSFVFVDDNPAEREIVRQNVEGVGIPEIENVEDYIRILDKAGYFEVTNLSKDDMQRSSMYVADSLRTQCEQQFANYDEYLKSLEMSAEIGPFSNLYMARIAQLTNKSNQFNLTTRRYSQSEIESMAQDPQYMTLYGKLEDRFGDNGVVSVVAGKICGDKMDLILWLMSCRVLKRDMEFAMMEQVVEFCKVHGIKKIYGYYFKTPKNAMVKDFYSLQGFDKLSEDENENTVWLYDLETEKTGKKHYISINKKR